MADPEEQIEQVRKAIIEGDQTQAVSRTRAALDAGVDPLRLLREGLTRGADIVGQYFEEGTYFLPQLMLTGRALKTAMEIVVPVLKEQNPEAGRRETGTVVMATVQTDVHDIGKNLVASMLAANGFTVHDLGVDVPLDVIIDKAIEVDADLIGCSALLTTSAPYLRDLVDLLAARGLRERFGIMVGGASVTEEYAHSINADGTAPDAVSAVRLAKKLLAEIRQAD